MRGIITGCDASQELFLPWWWWHTRRHTDLPVAFIDFGMSERARSFCKERGELIKLPPADFVVGRESIPEERAAHWERVFVNQHCLWRMRRAWYLKPFALLHAPFSQGIWLDLDCALRESLDPLFDDLQGELSLAPEKETSYYSEHALLPEGAVSYNTGVILYSQGSSLLSRWAERCKKENDQFVSEQLLLNMMVFEGAPVQPLPRRYNWNMRFSGCDEIAIAHYVGNGKEKIGVEMQLLHALGQIEPL